jgi:hypothetical protein
MKYKNCKTGKIPGLIFKATYIVVSLMCSKERNCILPDVQTSLHKGNSLAQEKHNGENRIPHQALIFLS